MSLIRHHHHEVPGLNTASLPDLIFTVLFFFMIVTHMRKVTLRVHYQMPQGTEVTRLVHKSAVSYIYIGRPEGGPEGSTAVQLNDKLATPEEVGNYIESERQRLSPEELDYFTVSVKADRGTKMSLINEVKQQLRSSDALNISYTATEEGKK